MSVESLLRESESCFESKDFSGSLEKADKAIEVEPNSAVAH